MLIGAVFIISVYFAATIKSGNIWKVIGVAFLSGVLVALVRCLLFLGATNMGCLILTGLPSLPTLGILNHSLHIL